MKVLVVLSMMVAVTEHGGRDVVSDVSAAIARTAELPSWEPAAMLLFGALLIGTASAVRRLI